MKLPADRTGDGLRSGLADAAHRHAQMLGLDDDDGPARVELAHQRVGDLAGQPFQHLLTFGVMPIGSLAGGALASSFGIRPAMFLAASGILLAAGWLVFSPLRRVRRLQHSPMFTAQQGVVG